MSTLHHLLCATLVLGCGSAAVPASELPASELPASELPAPEAATEHPAPRFRTCGEARPRRCSEPTLRMADDARPSGVGAPSFVCTEAGWQLADRDPTEGRPPRLTPFAPDGALGAPASLTAFASLGAAMGASALSSTDSLLLATGIVAGPGEHDIFGWQGGDAFPITSAPGVDAEPVIAAGSGGRFGVAWRTPRGLSFAIVSADRAEPVVILEDDTSVSGHAVVPLPDGGWMVIAGQSFSGGVIVHLLGEDGARRARRVLAIEGTNVHALWDGDATVVALNLRPIETPASGAVSVFGSGSGGRGFEVRRPRIVGERIAIVRIAADGTAGPEVVLVDGAPPGLQPTSLVRSGDRYWLALALGWSASRDPAFASILRVDREGTIDWRAELPLAARYVTLATDGAGARGAAVGVDGRLQTFAVTCAEP